MHRNFHVELPSLLWIVGDSRVLFRMDVMTLTIVLIQGPCPLASPEILTVAHMLRSSLNL